MLAIESVAIRVAKRNQFFFSVVRINAENFVESFIADIHEAGLIPNRSLRESKARGNPTEFGIVVKSVSKTPPSSTARRI
jgi:hypothetical protein